VAARWHVEFRGFSGQLASLAATRRHATLAEFAEGHGGRDRKSVAMTAKKKERFI
jgi:hypothetical protein